MLGRPHLAFAVQTDGLSRFAGTMLDVVGANYLWSLCSFIEVLKGLDSWRVTIVEQ
jgi:hypothetical protein